MTKLALANHPFYRLEVDAKLALTMFEDNVYKRAQIPSIAARSTSGEFFVVKPHFFKSNKGVGGIFLGNFLQLRFNKE